MKNYAVAILLGAIGGRPICNPGYQGIDDFCTHTLPNVETVVITAVMGILSIVGSTILGRLNVQPLATIRADDQALKQVDAHRLLDRFDVNSSAGTHSLCTPP